MRKIRALILVIALVLTLTSCQKNADNLRGDTDSKDALRICIDVGYSQPDDTQKMLDTDDFILSLKQSGGLENVVLEVIPRDSAERAAAITRIRTEIMAGSGPDVFIVDSKPDTDVSKALFPYPEKVMEAGLFLPLDEYMENNTEFAEWDKMQPVVLAAGRNEEGQQIIPLSYTFPVQTCQVKDFTFEIPDEPVTWQDTLTDPALFAVYAQFNDCTNFFYGTDSSGERKLFRSTQQYMEYILGRLADFEEEELLFTEEELLLRIEEILAMQENAEYDENSMFTNQLMGSSVVNDSSIPITMMPMYSDDGGITVTIENFAVVNRNTRYPQEAYRVIDILLREHTQLTKRLYTDGLCGSEAIPLYDEAFHRDAPFKLRFFSDQSYEKFTQVKQQITAANFRSSLSYDLNMLLVNCAGENDPVIREALVHAAYESMQRKVRE